MKLNIKGNKDCNIKINDNKLSIRSAKEMFEELGFIKDNYSYEYRRYREWEIEYEYSIYTM
mgnify:CR=1 FL=1